MQKSTQSNFSDATLDKPPAHRRKAVNKYHADVVCLSLAALAIVVFLSVAFVWFDGSNLPSNHSSQGEVQQPAVQRHPTNPSAPRGDLIATASSSIEKTPFEFLGETSASFVYGGVQATLAPDNMMWRYTADGWQDISKMTNRSQTPKPVLERVHPAVWTAMLFLSSLILLVMASSDQEINRLFSTGPDSKV